MKKILLTTLFLLSAAAMNIAQAEESETDIAKATQNPLGRNPEAKYYTLPVTGFINGDYGQAENTQIIVNAKPVIPLTFTPDYDFILRPIITVYHQPNTTTGSRYINGWGDLNPTAFIAPAQTSRLLWGIGPTLFIPIASNKALGTGKWSLGPQLCLMTILDKWEIGFLTSNVWSFAGDSQRQSVSQFSFQYLISYNLHKGWYLTSNPTITANWKAAGNKQWVVPVGGGFGRAFHIGKQSFAMSLEGFYNPIRPANLGPNWTVEAKFEMLWPDTATRMS